MDQAYTIMSFRNLLREPLVHFLGLGLLVFLINYVQTGGQNDDQRTIVVSEATQARLADTWLRTTGRAPTEQDKEGLVAQYVQEEALAREAEQLGMAEGDEIIRGRLAQKMRFIAGGDGDVAEPSDRELKSWFEENRDQFNISETRSFNHVYFSPERHGEEIENVASATLNRLKNGIAWQSLGDPFMQKRTYVTVPQGEVIRAFGPDFAEAIFALPKGEWSKPVGSAFGLHLVRIEAIDQAAKADFEANRSRILSAYQKAKTDEGEQKAIARIIDRYDVILAE